MMYALVALVAFQAVALLWALHVKDSRVEVERTEWAAERRELLQRIQAPEVAVAQVATDLTAPDGLMYVPIDDDEAFFADQEQMSG